MKFESRILNGFVGFFTRINRFSFVLILLFVGILTAAGSVILFYDNILLSFSNLDESDATITIIDFIAYCFLAPVLETLIFVVLPYKIFISSSLLRKYPFLVIIISSSLFTILHVQSTSNINLFPHFFLTSFVWMFGYFSRIEKDGKTFWLVVLPHGIYNLITVLGEIYAM